MELLALDNAESSTLDHAVLFRYHAFIYFFGSQPMDSKVTDKVCAFCVLISHNHWGALAPLDCLQSERTEILLKVPPVGLYLCPMSQRPLCVLIIWR